MTDAGIKRLILVTALETEVQGMIAEDGKELYCKLNNYDKTQIDDWLKDNVIANLHNTNFINTEYGTRT